MGDPAVGKFEEEERGPSLFAVCGKFCSASSFVVSAGKAYKDVQWENRWWHNTLDVPNLITDLAKKSWLIELAEQIQW